MDPGLSLKLLGKNYSSPGVVKLNDYGLGVAENPAVTMRGASFLRIKLTQEESQAKRYRAQDQLHWRPQIQTNLNSTLSLDLGAIFPFFFFLCQSAFCFCSGNEEGLGSQKDLLAHLWLIVNFKDIPGFINKNEELEQKGPLVTTWTPRVSFAFPSA